MDLKLENETFYDVFVNNVEKSDSCIAADLQMEHQSKNSAFNQTGKKTRQSELQICLGLGSLETNLRIYLTP